MKALQYQASTSVASVELVDVRQPTIGSDELLVKVLASGLNPLDNQIRRGDYISSLPFPCRAGFDASGEVVGIGADVHDFAVGDEVYYQAPIFDGIGTAAELHVIAARYVAKKPRNLSHIEAASLPLASQTAWHALFERAGLQAGEQVFIGAGAGGVGSLAIQMARGKGARVITTCRPEMNHFVEHLGAEAMINYRQGDVPARILQASGGAGVEVVLDTIGGKTLEEAPLYLKTGGRVATLVDISLPQNLLGAWGVNATYHFIFISPTGKRLEQITALCESATLKPTIDSVYPLSEANEAYERLQKGGLVGKIVLDHSR